MPKKKLATGSAFSKRTKDLPATQGMLQLVRSEVKSDIRGLRSEMHAGFNQVESRFSQIDSRFNEIDSRFSQIDSRFSQIDSRFNQIDAKFSQIDSRFNHMDSKLEQVLAGVARIGFLVEEQNSRNIVVLEGLTNLYHRQDRADRRMDEMENVLQGLALRAKR